MTQFARQDTVGSIIEGHRKRIDALERRIRGVAGDIGTGGAIGEGAITSFHIASNAVTFAELADNSVDADAIQDGVISEAKLDFTIPDLTDIAYEDQANIFTETQTISVSDPDRALNLLTDGENFGHIELFSAAANSGDRTGGFYMDWDGDDGYVEFGFAKDSTTKWSFGGWDDGFYIWDYSGAAAAINIPEGGPVRVLDRNLELDVSNSLIIGGDANLYRAAANTLKTDDGFKVVSPLTADDALSVDAPSGLSGAYILKGTQNGSFKFGFSGGTNGGLTIYNNYIDLYGVPAGGGRFILRSGPYPTIELRPDNGGLGGFIELYDAAGTIAHSIGNAANDLYFTGSAVGSAMYFRPGGGGGIGIFQMSGTAAAMQIPLTMSANIAMSSNRVTGLAAAVANGQAIRYEQMFVAGANMLIDSSFEGINVTSNYVPTNGTFDASTDVDPRYGLSKTGKLTATGSSQAYIYHNFVTGIKVGTEYAYSGWARGDGSTTNNWYIQISYYTAADVFISAFTSPHQALSTTWTRTDIVSTAPATAAKALVYVLFETNTAGKIMYMDGLQLEEGSMPTGYAPKPDEILPETIGTNEIEAGSITAAKITSHTITALQIGAGVITANEILAHTITANEILADTITASEIAADAITTIELAADAVEAGNILAGAVTAGKLNVTIGGGNLLPANTNAEYGNITGWDATGSGLSAFSSSTDQAKFGTTSFKLTVTGGWAFTNSHSSYLAKVETGKKYTISGWARAHASNAAARDTLPYVYLNTTGYLTTGVPVALSKTSWTKFSYTFTALTGDTTASALMLISGATSGEIFYFAGMQIEEGDVPTAWSQPTADIAPGTIQASHINVSTLSAISADLGTITAGTITGAIFQTATSDPRVRMDSTGLFATDASANKVVYLTTSGLNLLSGTTASPPDERKIQWKSGSDVVSEIASYSHSGSDFNATLITTKETSSVNNSIINLRSETTLAQSSIILNALEDTDVAETNLFAIATAGISELLIVSDGNDATSYVRVQAAGAGTFDLIRGNNTSDWAFRNELPWRIEIDPKNQSTSNTNFGTLGTAGTSDSHYGYLISSGAQNAEVVFDVVMAAGTWSIYFDTITYTDRGIFTVYLDADSQGTVDTYAAGLNYAQRKSLTGLSVTTTGKKALKFKMATKNGSSSSYVGVLTAITLIRTA